MAGTNRALLSEMNFSLACNSENRPTCIFISHKKEDEAIAVAVGDYLMNQAGLDIYLDINNLELQEAVSAENDKKIVESIKRGLECSDVLLCIITDKTRLSWWVPYEIGIADDKGKKVASVKTKEIDDFPEFLKINKTISDTAGFLDFVSELGPYGLCCRHLFSQTLEKKDSSHIQEYFG